MEAWREHFTINAGDCLAAACWGNPALLQEAMLRCFKRRPRSTKINEHTVCAVLSELDREARADADATTGV